LRYSWPGNVRELENKMERYVVTKQLFLGDGEKGKTPEDMVDDASPLPNLLEYLDDIEKRILRLAHTRCSTTREMAESLGVNQSTIVRKLKKHNL
jgi:transcriptional regulator with PAS, ATPase and Fis domain